MIRIAGVSCSLFGPGRKMYKWAFRSWYNILMNGPRYIFKTQWWIQRNQWEKLLPLFTKKIYDDIFYHFFIFRCG